MIPISKPSLGEEEAALCKEAILSGWVAQGPKVKELEEKVASYLGVRHAVAFSNCTTALHGTLLSMGVVAGDEVIVPSQSFIATANSVKYCGAEPVFSDVIEETLCPDVKSVESLISSKTKVIMAVHQIGNPTDMEPLLELGKKRGIAIMEDAACAFGTEYKGKRIGGHSEAACFSFHPRKLITTGEGGMVTTNNSQLEKKLRLLRQHGMSVPDTVRSKADKLIIEQYLEVGYNYRMSDIQAAVGIAQLEKVDGIIGRRRGLAKRYNDAFRSCKGLAVHEDPLYGLNTYQSYMLRLTKDCPVNRDQLLEALIDKKIMAKPGIMLAHREPAYSEVEEYWEQRLPVSARCRDRSILLPMYSDLSEEEQDFVIENVLERVK